MTKKEKDHQYYLKHKEEIKARVKKYAKEHSEEIKMKNRIAFQKRNEKRKAQQRYTVYLRTNKVTGMQYVGQTENFEGRESDWNCIKVLYANRIINEDREKDGLENWTSEILAVVGTREEAWELEQKYIKELNTRFPNGYNLAKGGGGASGISAWNKGLKGCFSEETRQKMSVARIGKKPWNNGIKGCYSEETLKKMSEAKKGKPNLKLAIPVYQCNDKYELIAIYPSAAEAARQLGLSSGAHISDCCNGKRRVCVNSKWMYKEDYEKMLEDLASQHLN